MRLNDQDQDNTDSTYTIRYDGLEVCSWCRSSLSQRPLRIPLLPSQVVSICDLQRLQGTPLVARARTATGQRSFAVNGSATWNRLPPALR